MAEKNYFEHVDPAGQSPADRVRAVGYSEKLVGENIAYGPSRSTKWCRDGSTAPGIVRTSWIRASPKWASGWLAGHAKHGLYWVQVLAEPRACRAVCPERWRSFSHAAILTQDSSAGLRSL